MAEATETHTELGLGDATAHAPEAGVVVIYSELEAIRGARAVAQRVVVGRDPEASAWPLADGKISRAHLALTPDSQGVVVEDLGSHNGTFVNGALVRDPCPAGWGAIVRLGRSLLMPIPDVRPYRGFPPELAAQWLVGGPRLDPLRTMIRRLGPSRLPILVCGETGSGKERVARALHHASARPGELVSINCAAIPADLVESELFGHVAGAFSGATASRDGLFRRAHGGTLFLDEVGELALHVQAKLLRVLEDGAVRPVGGNHEHLVDVRLVTATHRRLEDMVAEGRFRADLHHRIAGAVMPVPALADHREDIPLLARLFAQDSRLTLAAGAVEELCLRSWPGNVRGLRNAVEHGIASATAERRDRIERADLPAAPSVTTPPPPTTDREIVVRLTTALELRKGNVAQVARDLGLSRSRLYQLLREHGITPGDHRDSG
jgi:DNA-binding NtrC family response regulator